jgi:hypothetical protein
MAGERALVVVPAPLGDLGDRVVGGVELGERVLEAQPSTSCFGDRPRTRFIDRSSWLVVIPAAAARSATVVAPARCCRANSTALARPWCGAAASAGVRRSIDTLTIPVGRS